MDYQNLNNLPEINFKSKERPKLIELSNYIDGLKKDLFSDKWSTATKKHIKASLVLYIRSMQKQLAPNGAHYKVATSMSHKEHLEHPIPQTKIVTAYLHDKLSARQVLQMPLCIIDEADKHILEGEWQTMATWEHPFFVLRNGNYSFQQTLSLKVGDKVFTTENDFIDITSVVRVDEELETVNINCEPYDVYFAEGILLHNVHDKDA